MNRDILQRKIDGLRKYQFLNTEILNNMELYLEEHSVDSHMNINPYKFAEEQNYPPGEVIDIFLYGTKTGLFNFEWNLLCPYCGGIVHNHGWILDLTNPDYHCAVCDVNHTIDLDQYIEVAFTLVPEVQEASSDPFIDYRAYKQKYFSNNHQWSDEFNHYYYNESFKGFNSLEPDVNKTILIETEPGFTYRIASPDNNALLKIETGETEVSDLQHISVDLTSAGFTPDTQQVPAGRTSIKIMNHLHKKCGLITLKVDHKKALDIFSRGAPYYNKYLTGKELLNHQSFRDLFKVKNLQVDFRLKVSNLTVVFTDLKGSTAMYDRIGDFHAFSLVQRHFEQLRESTLAHGGAIIKTIGDAVMASFSTPEDGINAARDMMRRIKELNSVDEFKEEDMSIKVGIHSGTAIAVTANEILDYFGQTVNMAARVQGLSDGGEVWITDNVLKNRDVRRTLIDSGVRCFKRSASLKGISQKVTVYQCKGW